MMSIRMSPLNQLDALRSQMDALFHGFPAVAGEPGAWPRRAGAQAPVFPAINAWETEQALWVEAELPGFRMDDLDITLLGNELTIRGKRGADAPGGHAYIRRERPAGEFVRSLRLPVEVDVANVSARLVSGVLTIELPKAPEAKPRRIEVKTSQGR